VRAVRFIQKTIHVTSPTAMKDVMPANSSSPRSDNSAEVKERNAPSAKVAASAAATPVQSGLRKWRRSVRTM